MARGGRGEVRRGREGLPQRVPRGPQPEPGGPRRRVPRPRRPVRLRQDDRAAHGRRARGDLRRHGDDRRPRRQRPVAEGARHRDGLPELRALPAPERGREHRLRAPPAEGVEGRDQRARGLGREAPRPHAVPPAPAEGALRRPAPARGDGPRDRAPAAGVPHGRAALEPRRQAPRPDARGHLQAPARPRDDDDLRHARPGRGDDDGRPRGGDELRRPPAGGHAAAALRQPREPVRGRVHRHAADEPHRGDRERRRRRRDAVDRGTGDPARARGAAALPGPARRERPPRGHGRAPGRLPPRRPTAPTCRR